MDQKTGKSLENQNHHENLNQRLAPVGHAGFIPGKNRRIKQNAQQPCKNKQYAADQGKPDAFSNVHSVDKSVGQKIGKADHQKIRKTENPDSGKGKDQSQDQGNRSGKGYSNRTAEDFLMTDGKQGLAQNAAAKRVSHRAKAGKYCFNQYSYSSFRDFLIHKSVCKLTLSDKIP